MKTKTIKLKKNYIPNRIKYYNMILDLSVVPTKMTGDTSFKACYFHGNDPQWIKYGATEEAAKENLWNFISEFYPEIKIIQES